MNEYHHSNNDDQQRREEIEEKENDGNGVADAQSPSAQRKGWCKDQVRSSTFRNWTSSLCDC
jgi:hypothetical protein